MNMAKYGICNRCKEPSILGHVPCINDGTCWLCPDCACEWFNLPKERAIEVKKTLINNYEQHKKRIIKIHRRLT